MRSGPVWLTHLPAEPGDDGPVRVAFAIGRTVGGAVVRNRLRRRLRAILLDAIRSSQRIPPGAYLVGVRPEATTLSFAELRTRMHAALRELQDPGS